MTQQRQDFHMTKPHRVSCGNFVLTFPTTKTANMSKIAG